jgi:hypothetical protein
MDSQSVFGGDYAGTVWDALAAGRCSPPLLLPALQDFLSILVLKGHEGTGRDRITRFTSFLRFLSFLQ